MQDMGFQISEYIAIEEKHERRLVAQAHIPEYSTRLGNDVSRVTEQMLTMLEGCNVIAVLASPHSKDGR